MKNNPVIGPNKVISMQYALTNGDGIVIRDAAAPAIQYVHGSSALPRKLESELEGHGVGDIVRVRLLPDDAFGQRDVDLVHQVPVAEIPHGESLEIGGSLAASDEAGNTVTFTIKDIRDGTLHLDANHPLAGQTLIFEVEIQSIRDASETEIRNGKVETPPGH